jgi:23S rRNA pseudouridine1911/1915/1917 synthase
LTILVAAPSLRFVSDPASKAIILKMPHLEYGHGEVRGGISGGTRRLDLFLAEALGLSRAEVSRLIARGGVTIDGRAARKGDELFGGETITIDAPGEEARRAIEADASVPLAILYEDAHIVAVEKPPGVACLPNQGGERGTIANALVARAPEQALIGGPREAGLVHRLDTGTSGVLLAARTHEAYARLRERWSSGEVVKTYFAIVEGVVAEGGVIDALIAHHAKSTRRMVLASSRVARSAQPARTDYEPLRSGNSRTLLRVWIREGRRHQIRVHLASIGYPVAGDPIYGLARTPRDAKIAVERLALHSHRLALAHPASGEAIEITSPLPADLAALVATEPNV